MQIIVSVIAIILIWIFVIVKHDTSHFVVRLYELTSKKIREELTIVLLSDLHEKDYGADNKKLLEAIEAQHPDLVLCAGDLITCHHHPSHCRDKTAVSLVRALAKRYPVVVANGNHETKLAEAVEKYGDYYARYEEQLKDAGACVLRNAWEKGLLDHVDIAGLEITSDWYGRFPKETLSGEKLHDLLGAPDAERFTILIAHDPRHFKAYAAWGADLAVSGHVHGGIARIPGIGGVIAPSFELFPHYDAGEFTMEGEGRVSTLILSCGLGTHTLHVRFNNPGEVAVIRLHPAA